MEKWRLTFWERHTFDYILKSDRKTAEGIIERFKKQNPALMQLNPEIGILQFKKDADGNKAKFFILIVGHRYIFDYRLLPSHFENLEVKSNLCENMPKEFPYPYPGMQIEEYHSPDRYILFVKRNIEKIRKTLHSENMTVDEALNALTGTWINHLKWVKELKEKKVMEHKEHLKFFNELLEKTKVVYYQSDVFKQHGNKNWGYSVTATSFEKHSKVIVGFNWGVDNNWIKQGHSYGPQKDYPLKNFTSSYDDLGSLKRTFSFFHNHFETIPEVQVNYCFFRSEREDQITAKDLKLSGELFDSLIQYLEPSMLISFSKTLNDYLSKTEKLIPEKPLEIKSGNKHFLVTKGKVKISDKEIDYFNLPHPNYPITREARVTAWDYCFKDKK